MAQPTLSVIIPALNEERNLEATVKNVQETVPQFFEDWEIIIFNDGSTDATGRIAERLVRAEPRIHVVHHLSPRNLGACYKAGIQKATKDYLIMIPGDNECGTELMKRVFSLVGTADMIVPYTANPEVRPYARRVFSRFFVGVVNKIAGQNLRYYNGAVLHRTEFLKNLRVRTDGFGYQAEILVKLLGKGHTFREVGADITYRPYGKSKAVKISSLFKVAAFVANLALSRFRPVH